MASFNSDIKTIIKSYILHSDDSLEDRLYLRKQLQSLALITTLFVAGSVSFIGMVTVPVGMILNPDNDHVTWRVMGISPLLLNFLCLWLFESTRRYALEIIAVTYSIGCFGLGWAISNQGGLDKPFIYSLYALPFVTGFFPFAISLRTIATFSFVVAVLSGYFLANPQHLDAAHTNNVLFTFLMFGIFSIFGGHHVYNLTRETILAQKIIGAEKEKSENLLINMLPESIANKLKEDTSVIADSFPEASVLFVDIADFTPLSTAVPPEELVSLLNIIMSEFDELTNAYELEKIKTIGDAYMVAGGVPKADKEHPKKIANLALDMIEVISKIEKPGGGYFSARIGINSGEIVAGVIGTKKFIYDLWGDAVNIASRMESHGEVGRIQITSTFNKLINDDFVTEYRGEIDVKGKGLTKTWWLVGRKP